MMNHSAPRTSAAWVLLPGLLLTCMDRSPAFAQAPAELRPTRAEIAYGPHPRQVLDLYQAQGEGPRPVMFFVHGGGWMTGDKAKPDFLSPCLEHGISVVSINYRLILDADKTSRVPPVKTCLDDASRALQFVRYHAKDWNLDKQRIAGCGGSAGGFTVLWLAFHPELADTKSTDPVARESTRLTCALAFVPQTTLDPELSQTWIPNNEYGPHAFGLPNMPALIEKRQELLPWIRKFSPYDLASADDPPVLLFYDSTPQLGQPHKDPPHSANWGAGLGEKLRTVGIEHELNYNNDFANMKYPNLFSFLTAKLTPQNK